MKEWDDEVRRRHTESQFTAKKYLSSVFCRAIQTAGSREIPTIREN
jgi:hypothetical protein